MVKKSGTAGNRLTEIAMTIAGRDPSGDAMPPRTGTDASSRRHFLALIIGTLLIMTVGLIVAFTSDGPKSATATPTVITTPTATSALTIVAHVA